ncbi:MAG: class I SAM-dependent DNA methyltransferase, partial [Candidatus Hodarchaeota archaeon]
MKHINLKIERTIYRKDLIQARNLKQVFKTIRNYLAGNISGITRDEILAEQLIFLLFCKIKDELTVKPDEPVNFQINHPNSDTLIKRISRIFIDLKKEYNKIFEENDSIILDEETLKSIVKELENLCITEASRDAIGDAFEIFLGPSLRGNKGQFFTPKNVVKIMIKILDPRIHEKIIDPACGSGGFLIEAVTYLKRGLNNTQNDVIWERNVRGIDKDRFLAKIANIYLMILGLKYNPVHCENSLVPPTDWSSDTFKEIGLGQFDIVVTNPPFGVKIPINSEKTLKQYHIGYKWRKKEKLSKRWEKTDTIQEKQPPQLLFIERCLDLLKEGGRMGIVLPDGLFGNPSNRYVLQFLQEKTKIIAIISCSHLTFLPHTHTKTSLLFLEKKIPKKDYTFFMAIAENVGHDKNGKSLYIMDKKGNYILNAKNERIINDDFPKIIKNYKRHQNGEL